MKLEDVKAVDVSRTATAITGDDVEISLALLKGEVSLGQYARAFNKPLSVARFLSGLRTAVATKQLSIN